MDDYLKKVKLLANEIYEYDSEIIEAFAPLIVECYNNNFTPRRTVEAIAEVINFGLNS